MKPSPATLILLAIHATVSAQERKKMDMESLSG